jgi:hypothetical protein
MNHHQNEDRQGENKSAAADPLSRSGMGGWRHDGECRALGWVGESATPLMAAFVAGGASEPKRVRRSGGDPPVWSARGRGRNLPGTGSSRERSNRG